MDKEPEFIRYLRDQLRQWAPIEVKRMFGGHGVYRDGTMFALIQAETLYLRSDNQTQPDFAAAGMGPFRYRRNGKLVALDYHQVPPDALEESELLARWAGRAYDAALRRAAIRAQAAKQTKTQRGRSNRR
jgi:DNA transformation protein